ncbi:histidine--tRNA ligase [Candidatus Riesia pediculicola]|uniref:histidine--tRNA ligase n=1 Tax=Candidatus Riesia pediculicola TaxID=401619 RepID=UPI0009C1E625|nr:histidine--tRNA ligase [Candidatus Riesia pediculicola]ARC54267.1 hypothetical protein AOE57_01500 [Candidatus Riesia pediculicola]
MLKNDMFRNVRSLRGMKDVLPRDSHIYRTLESKIQEILFQYGFQEIRTPILEKTELFERTIGKKTEVVRKEMYTFLNKKGNTRISLRPENTVSCARAGIENGLFRNKKQRLWYLGPMFRYDRPQYGRNRQFHQLGIEMFGFNSPVFDAELISIMFRIWKSLAIDQYITLELNSIGSISDREIYRNSLKKFFQSNLKKLSLEDQKIAISDPIRLLDSKDPNLNQLLVHAPLLEEYIGKECMDHFYELCRILQKIGIRYVINKRLVRGLDYYNRTVFEWVSGISNFQKTICAGGRYDYLMDLLGYNRSVPSLGCAIGIERLVILIKEVNQDLIHEYHNSKLIDIYLCKQGLINSEEIFFFSERIRSRIKNVSIMIHHGSDKTKKQVSKAIQNNAKIVIILKENFYRSNKILIKNLKKKGSLDIIPLEKLYDFLDEIR